MTVRAVALASKWTGVHATVPIEGGASTSGGAVSVGGTITLPSATKTTTNGVAVSRFGGHSAATGYSAWGAGTWTGSWTTAASGATASPNLADQVFANGYETTPAAPGTITGPTVTLTTGHGLSSWAARTSILKPSGGTAPAFVSRTTLNIDDSASAGTLSFAIASLANNQFLILEVELDDATAVLTAPDGTWTQAYSVTHTNGVIVGFYKYMPSSGTTGSQTFNFGVSVTVAAPSNTGAPVASGTAAVGATLSTTNGTWSPAATSYAYQWKRDGVSISGATAQTYAVVSADAGHVIRSTVVATNSGGSSSVATSNAITIPAAPVNSVAPAVTTDGSPATGETITVSTGTWSPTPDTYTYQWYSGSGTATGAGATTSSYTLVLADEGQNVRCDVTATTGGGSTVASSNVIVPAVTAAISDSSLVTYYSGGTGNTNPALSIGGGKGGSEPFTLNDLFGPVLGTVAQSGGVFYAVLYVANTHTISTAAAGKAYIETQFPSGSGLDVSVAVPAEAKNVAVAALASNTTAPAGVTWNNAIDPTTGLDFGSLAPGDYRGLYVRLTVSVGATPSAEVDAGWAVAFSAA